MAQTALAQSADEALYEAAVSYSSGDLHACIDFARRVIDSATSNADQKKEAYAFAGASYYRLADSVQAENLFSKCIRLDPSHIPGLNFTDEIRLFYREVKRAIMVSFKITSDPPGATVFVDGDSVGHTPYTRDTVFAGDFYSLLLTQPCRQPARAQAQIEKGKQNLFHYELKELFCPLHISRSPSDAKVQIVDLEGYNAPWTDSIPCGSAFHAKVTRKGYRDTSITVTCNSSEKVSHFVTLAKVSVPGGGALKYVTSATLVIAVGAYGYFERDARNCYKRYTESVDLKEINTNWDKYEKRFVARNASGWAATGLASVSLYLWSKYVWGKVGHRYVDVGDPLNSPAMVRILLNPGDQQLALVAKVRF
jgi:tetratricopeptide (TPR) repeat protein